MTQQQFNEACRYANSSLKGWQVAQALECIEYRMPIPCKINEILVNAMNEWCEDNDIADGEWLEWGDTEDVFFNQE